MAHKNSTADFVYDSNQPLASIFTNTLQHKKLIDLSSDEGLQELENKKPSFPNSFYSHEKKDEVVTLLNVNAKFIIYITR